MQLPNWAVKYKEPKTEIKYVNGCFYKYEVKYQYNAIKKRTDKITVKLLGKISEVEGFVPSDKDLIRQKSEKLPNVDIKIFGVYKLFSTLLNDEIKSLSENFKTEIIEKVIVFSMMRWAYQTPIKRLPNYHSHDFCSEIWSVDSISDKQISSSLKFCGENREAIVAWMKLQMNIVKDVDRFFMMDSTHVTTVSDNLGLNAVGYNPSHNYSPQIRLMYLFSAEFKQPVYYRLINGNTPDIKSMSLCLKEICVENIVFIADKGFYSNNNIIELNAGNFQYIIPLQRSNKLINFAPLKKKSLKNRTGQFFTYQKRIVWYYEYKNEGKSFITFLDEHLRVVEEEDYLSRINSHPEKYSIEHFHEKKHVFGTLTFIHKLNSETNAKTLYESYKQRNEIEVMFDSYKNFLHADKMYMQDRHVLEGWLMANFIAMIAYYKLYSRLLNANLLSKYSPKDIIEISKSIYKTKINGEWHTSEITKKTLDLMQKIKIDYLN